MSGSKINEATLVTLCADSAARTLSSDYMLTTIVRVKRISTLVFARTARMLAEKCAAPRRVRAGRPSDACCSVHAWFLAWGVTTVMTTRIASEL